MGRTIKQQQKDYLFFLFLQDYGTVWEPKLFGVVVVLVWMELYDSICMKQSPECMMHEYITLLQKREQGVCLMLSKVYNWIFFSLCLLQPDIFIYNWRSCCWYFGIYRLERICLLLTSHGNYFTWARSQSKIFNPHILWFLEPCSTWWLSRWSNGRLFMFVLSFFWPDLYMRNFFIFHERRN